LRRIYNSRRLILQASLFACAAIVISIAAPAADCQSRDVSPPQQVIHVSTELVKLNVTVLDKHGDFAAGLEKKDFRILDNSVEQPTLFFAPVDSPAQVLVVVETGPAVFLIHDQHIAAAYALLDGLAPDDQVGLVTYDQTPHLLLPFTSDKHALLDSLGKIQFVLGMGDLNFYDSVSTIIDSLPAEAGKRALVLLTTGLDSSTPERWDALAQKLRTQDVVIYSVALGGSFRNYMGKKAKPAKKSAKPAPQEENSSSTSNSGGSLSFARSTGSLLALAKITGGRAYFPQAQDDFAAIYREVASALRHQYVLGISPQHDGQFHLLTVQMLGSNGQPVPPATKKQDYRIYAREGYLAPGP
jgi:Ca-activated chloride channel homolog